MKKRRIGTILAGTAVSILLYSWNINAGDISNGAFSVKEKKILNVMDGNKVFIEKDGISYLNFNSAEELIQGTKDKVSAINVIHKNDEKMRYRKEIALHPDGHIELNISVRFLPITDGSEKGIGYSFEIPINILNEMSFKAASGRAEKWKWIEGRLNSKTLDGDIVDRCRYVTFQGPDGEYTFDCNPPGQDRNWCRGGEICGYWNISKHGAYIRFSCGGRASWAGDIFTGKMLIYKGSPKYENRHAQLQWSSTDIPENTHIESFTFGTPMEKKDFIKGDCNVYLPEKKWGWKDSSSLKAFHGKTDAIVDNCVYNPTGERCEFIIDENPGVYLITLRCGHPTQKTGPFAISLNGKTVVENIEVQAGDVKTISLSQYLRAPERKLIIGFSGENMWALQSMSIRAMIFQNEDFTVDRGFWVMDKLFSPEIE